MDNPNNLNCRPGDLAIQVGATGDLIRNIGTIYDVIEYSQIASQHTGTHCWHVIPHSPVFCYHVASGTILERPAGYTHLYIEDQLLRPLRGAEDEFITVDKVVEHER